MKSGVAFVIGLALGSVCTWYAVKNKYERMAQEEIEEVRAFYSKKKKEEETMSKSENFTAEKEELKELINDLGYGNESMFTKTKQVYVIAADEFGEFPDYNQLSFKYFSDGILTNEDGVTINDINGVTPEDFEEYLNADDCVYMRDDMRCCDYEILRYDLSLEEYLSAKNS